MSEYSPNAPRAQQVSGDLFGFTPPADPNTLVGLHVIGPCPVCPRNVATIGEASLRCTACERHRGWMSVEVFDFVSDFVRRFGRPAETIVVRTPRDGGESEAVHQPKPNGD